MKAGAARSAAKSPKPARHGATGEPLPQRPVDQTVHAHRTVLQALFPIPPARAPRSRAVRRVGGVMGAVLVAGTVWWTDPAYRTEAFSTPVGGHTEVPLADGSRLVLDTATDLVVSWHVRSRRVELRQGRARFEVAPATWRPLTVAAGPAQVRVVGTRFDVWRQPASTRVSVYEGRVAVWRSDDPTHREIVLEKGQQIDVTQQPDAAGTSLAAGPFDVTRTESWKDGRLVFDNTPLREVAAELQRYRVPKIQVQGEGAANLALSGVFDSNRSEQLLALLPSILPVKVERQADGDVSIRKK